LIFFYLNSYDAFFFPSFTVSHCVGNSDTWASVWPEVCLHGGPRGGDCARGTTYYTWVLSAWLRPTHTVCHCSENIRVTEFGCCISNLFDGSLCYSFCHSIRVCLVNWIVVSYFFCHLFIVIFWFPLICRTCWAQDPEARPNANTIIQGHYQPMMKKLAPHVLQVWRTLVDVLELFFFDNILFAE
jgi:hypothetical protein